MTDMQRGEWVNVVGYVEGRTTNLRPESRARMDRSDEVVGVKVQAVMLWSAAGVNVGKYEKTLAEVKRVKHAIQTREDHEIQSQEDHEDIT